MTKIKSTWNCNIMKIAFISNEPPPYRVPVFRIAAREPGVEFTVFFCCRREPNRFWDLSPFDFPHVFLRERYLTVKGRYIHNNPDVFSALKKYAPDVVVTDGYNPTHLYAFAYALFAKCSHVAMTDGTDVSEKDLGPVHKIVRRMVYARTKAFVAASDGGYRLFKSYSISDEEYFKSCLCIDNAAFDPGNERIDKEFDFIFSGRLEEVKNPAFTMDVAVATAKRLGRPVKLLFAGAGSKEQELRELAASCREYVKTSFHGFATQAQLPRLYQSARLFLFPTLWDPWGVVANEACAAGLPVIVSPNAGVVDELVRDGHNGFVCKLEVDVWAERAAMLLQDARLYQTFSDASLSIVRDYTYRKAAAGLLAACRYAAGPSPKTIRSVGKY
jgi:glycosyltransferase involved in cell wall biosynthesis